MKKICLAALSLFAACAMAAQNTQTLASKHGSAWPVSADGFVTRNQCIACHGSYAELAKKTSDRRINPHVSHLGEVNCVECHVPEKASPELMCNKCHKFTVQKK